MTIEAAGKPTVQPGNNPGQSDPRALAASLEPALLETCSGRLSDIHWFRTDWQRGGAATATARWTCQDGDTTQVVVKLPVSDRELRWTARLQDDSDPVAPRLYASGDCLGGFDLAWIIIERLPHGPLGAAWNNHHIERIAESIARFYQATARYEVDREPLRENWDELLDGARQSIRNNSIPEKGRWSSALKTISQRLSDLVVQWRAREICGWIHGDLHIANAMSRVGLDDGSVVLIDLAEVRPGHWIEDAVYLERQFWAAPERIKATKPVKAIANARKALGLSVDPEYPKLATLRRAMLAATAPRFMRSEGDPRYLTACLERLEQSLPQLK